MTQRGLGDTIEAITKRTGIKWLAKLWSRWTGRDCGCESRRERLNKLVKYRQQGKQ